jgi:hypothetical protein
MQLRGNWRTTRQALQARWSRLTPDDVPNVAGDRDALVEVLRARYAKSYGELEREVTEFDLREVWAANMARPSLGIGNG